MLPFNISILEINEKTVQALRPITTLDSFDGASGNFNENGLFSNVIFGKPGDQLRDNRFSFINIKAPIFNPTYYYTLTSLKRLYIDIISGSDYAIWDDSQKDFVRSDSLNGETGFAFFEKHWQDIEFKVTSSDKRNESIELLKKYKNRAMTSKVLVIPAGLRDMQITEDGRSQEDDINGLYRQIFAIANTVPESALKHNIEVLNKQRWALQLRFNEVYRNIESRVEGKKKLVMGGWASRKVFNGTRNVITSMNLTTPYLGKPGALRFNNTIVGLYQLLKSILPITCHAIRDGFLKKVFVSSNMPTKLLAQTKNGWVQKEVLLKTEYFDKWVSNEGIEKILTLFADPNIRNKPVQIEGMYIGLTYKGPDGTFKLIQSLEEIPSFRLNKEIIETIKPITLCELIYFSTYRVLNDPIFVTRYPVTGVGSIYPSISYVKTTVKSEERRELSDSWEPMDDSYIATQCPLSGYEYIDSMMPHPAKIGGLGADYDGDMCSGNSVYSDEATSEVKKFLACKRAYVGTDGTFMSSTNISTTALVFHNFSI